MGCALLGVAMSIQNMNSSVIRTMDAQVLRMERLTDRCKQRPHEAPNWLAIDEICYELNGLRDEIKAETDE